MDYRELNIIGKLAKVFLDNYRITILMAISLVVVGLFAYQTLPREQTPEINIPIAVINTTYIGASPEDVESQITDKIEAHVYELDQINEINSTSSFSNSMIEIQFESDVDMDLMIQKIQNKIGEVEGELPEDADEPQVIKVDISDLPIMSVNLISDQGAVYMTDQAEFLQEELEKITGVSEVQISGDVEREIQINVDANRLALYGISLSQLAQTIQAENLNLPVGELEWNSRDYSVRVLGEFESIEEIGEIIISRSEAGGLIRLHHIASIEDKSDQTSSYARVSRLDENGEWETLPSLSLSILKQTGENLLEVGEKVKERLTQLQESQQLGDTQVIITGDGAELTQEEVSGLMRNVGMSIIIVALILIAFLGLYPALISALVIPLSMGAAFFLLLMNGMSINGLTLFSMILALGMLVDNGIVMVENIYRTIQTSGEGRRKCALIAANEIGIPLISAVLTTVSAFLPMVFMTGISGQYVRVIPLTVIFALMSSLIIGLVIVPYFASRLISTRHKGSKMKKKGEKACDFEEGFKGRFKRWLKLLITSRWRRRGALLTLGVLFIGAMSLPALGLVKSELFPESEVDQVFYDLTLPEGSTVDHSNEVAFTLEEEIKAFDGIENFVSRIGGAQENEIRLEINLVDKEERDFTSLEMMEELRAIDVPELVGTTRSLYQYSGGPPSDDPIVFRIQGEESEVLTQISEDLAQILESIEGTVQVDDGLSEPRQEYQIVFDREKTQRLGLSTAELASMLRTVQSGQKIGVYREAGDEIDIILQFQEADRENFEDLYNLSFMTSSGLVPLRAIANIELGGSSSTIQHYDLEKIITVRSKLKPGYNAGVVLAQFKAAIEDYPFPAGYDVLFGGDDEEVKESFGSLYRAMWISILLIYLILIAQFNSFIQPFIILVTLPLALIGVFGGLFITGYSLSFPAFIGVVALTGIVVNNAILIIDCINQQRKNGLELADAVIEGVNLRFRPILLTTLTTILAIIPTSLTDEVWGSLGFSIIFGLGFSTLLTLGVIPMLYFMLESRYSTKKRKQKGRARP